MSCVCKEPDECLNFANNLSPALNVFDMTLVFPTSPVAAPFTTTLFPFVLASEPLINKSTCVTDGSAAV